MQSEAINPDDTFGHAGKKKKRKINTLKFLMLKSSIPNNINPF